jgi:hypothetical protein
MIGKIGGGGGPVVGATGATMRLAAMIFEATLLSKLKQKCGQISDSVVVCEDQGGKRGGGGGGG